MSLLQPPHHSSSDGFVLSAPAGRDPNAPFDARDALPDETPVDLGLELDLAAERPYGERPRARGPGLFVGSIVAASLVLVGGIAMLRGSDAPTAASEPTVPRTRAAAVMASPEPAPVEPMPAEPAPAEPAPPSRIATRDEAAPPARAPASTEITPAAIGPTHPVRPGTTTPPLAADEPTELAPGLKLPAPVFDEPAVEPTPAVEPAPAPLPGIEEPTAVEPTPEPSEPESAA